MHSATGYRKALINSENWYASLPAWSVLIKLFKIDSINNNNNDNALLEKWRVNNNSDLRQGWQVNDDKFNNNKDKVCLLLRKWGWWVIC